MLGNWSAAGQADKCVTLLEGLKENAPATVKINYAKGCDVNSPDRSGFKEAIRMAQNSDFVILALEKVVI
jgi:beta-glucosidase